MKSRHALWIVVLAALSPLRAAAGEDRRRPEPDGDGHIRQGPFLVLSQGTPGLQVLRGTEVLIFDAGLSCQGRAGYFPYQTISTS